MKRFRQNEDYTRDELNAARGGVDAASPREPGVMSFLTPTNKKSKGFELIENLDPNSPVSAQTKKTKKSLFGKRKQEEDPFFTQDTDESSSQGQSVNYFETLPLNDKESLIKALGDILHMKLPRNFITEIIGDDFNMVGRAKIEGSTKQLCHVIPVALIKSAIKNAIKNSATPDEKLKNLKPILLTATKSKKGYAIDIEALNSEAFDDIRDEVNQHAYTNTNEAVFMSPGAADHVFKTPSRKAQAFMDFAKKNTKYVDDSYAKILHQLSDHNLANIFAELVTRFAIVLFNKSDNVVFAPEGNNLRYEIRLFEDSDEAQNATEKYQVISAKELKGKAENPKDIDGRIRVVSNEGNSVKASIKALEALKDIILQPKNINTYNKNHNKKLVLGNVCEGEISKYNNPLESNDTASIANHFAKHLYRVFDLKALEKDVFVPTYRGVKGDKYKIYSSASGEKTSEYCFDEGQEYRKDSINAAQGYKSDEFFRSVEKDLKILPQKLAELFVLGFSPFVPLAKNGYELYDSFLQSLVHLAEIDHEISEENIFLNNVQEICFSLMPFDLSFGDEEFKREEICLSGHEQSHEDSISSL